MLVIVYFGTNQMSTTLNIRFYSYLGFLILALLAGGCQKDSVNQPPVVSILEPKAQDTFNVFDTLYVDATATDEQGLTFISAELQNADLIRVSNPSSKNISGTEFRFRTALMIDDIHLESGKHFLQVTAKDNTETTRSFLELTVYGYPWFLNGYVLFLQNGNSISIRHFYPVDEANPFDLDDSLLSLYSEPFIDGLVQNYNQHLVTILASEGTLVAEAISPYSTSFSLSSSYGDLIYCQSNYETQMYQVGYSDGFLELINEKGDTRRLFESGLNKRPEISVIQGDRIVIWQKDINGINSEIQDYNLNGSLQFTLAFNAFVMGMIPGTDDEIILASNASEGGNIYRYNLSNGQLFSITKFENEPILALCKANNGYYYVSTNNGIYQFKPGDNSPSFVSQIVPTQMAFNTYNDVLVLTTSNEILLFSPISWTTTSVASFNGTPKKLDVWYSK